MGGDVPAGAGGGGVYAGDVRKHGHHGLVRCSVSRVPRMSHATTPTTSITYRNQHIVTYRTSIKRG